MSTVKIKQKIPMKEFSSVTSQIRGEGIHVITRASYQLGKVGGDDTFGKIIAAFNLGGKIALDVDSNHGIHKDSRIEKLDDKYYLVVP